VFAFEQNKFDKFACLHSLIFKFIDNNFWVFHTSIKSVVLSPSSCSVWFFSFCVWVLCTSWATCLPKNKNFGNSWNQCSVLKSLKNWFSNQGIWFKISLCILFRYWIHVIYTDLGREYYWFHIFSVFVQPMKINVNK